MSQIPAGWLASRIGGKQVWLLKSKSSFQPTLLAAYLCIQVLLYAVGAWSIATLLVWPAYKAGVGAVVLARIVVGMAEGANYPSQVRLTALPYQQPESDLESDMFECALDPSG